MARGDDPASATTSFFIVIGETAPSLDGKYTVFGRVVDGLDVVEKIAQVPLNGESPVTRVDLVRARPGPARCRDRPPLQRFSSSCVTNERRLRRF